MGTPLFDHAGWPQGSRIRILQNDGTDWKTSRAADFDLVSATKESWYPLEGSFSFHLKVHRENWDIWTEAHLKGIEDRIQADFNYDGFEVRIQRITGLGKPCIEEAAWELEAVPDLSDSDG